MARGEGGDGALLHEQEHREADPRDGGPRHLRPRGRRPPESNEEAAGAAARREPIAVDNVQGFKSCGVDYAFIGQIIIMNDRSLSLIVLIGVSLSRSASSAVPSSSSLSSSHCRPYFRASRTRRAEGIGGWQCDFTGVRSSLFYSSSSWGSMSTSGGKRDVSILSLPCRGCVNLAFCRASGIHATPAIE